MHIVTKDGSFDCDLSKSVNSHPLKAAGAYIQAACEEQVLREGRCGYGR